MCGIFAAISLDEPFNSVDFEHFVHSTDLVSYRGPDAAGYKIYRLNDKNANPEYFNVFFGHRRLSIIDLSKDGIQPMTSNGIHIIYNGEIFNYIELRDELKALNVNFRTNTDTEVILKIYETYGHKGFNKLNGMWAFIILDLNNNLIIASRDRFSIKPLYWIKKSHRLFFASEIKQLLNLFPTRELNLTVMSRFLHQGILDIDSGTFFKDIESIEPKHNYIINLNSKQIIKEKYWDYTLKEDGEKDVLEKFRVLFFDSVKIRLRSDVELGLLLSGGLDSSAISVVGKAISGDKFKTYSVVSENKKFSEEKFVDLLVLKNKLQNEKFYIKGSDILNNFNTVINQQDEPFLNFIVVAHYTILQKVKNDTNITVILNGQGGDEVLAGYLRFFFFNLKFLFSQGKYFGAMREILGSLFNRTVLMQWQISAAKRYLPKFKGNEKNIVLLKQAPENTWNFGSMSEAQIVNIDKYSIPPIAKYEDRNSMAHSLEIRLPFLDHRLVEFLINVDTNLKIKNGWNKYVLRQSLYELPEQIRWRRDKKGFILPEADWLKQDFREDIIFSFNNSRLEEFGIINSKYFLDTYNSYLNGNRRIHNLEISRIYIAEKWMKKFFN